MDNMLGKGGRLIPVQTGKGAAAATCGAVACSFAVQEQILWRFRRIPLFPFDKGIPWLRPFPTDRGGILALLSGGRDLVDFWVRVAYTRFDL